MRKLLWIAGIVAGTLAGLTLIRRRRIARIETVDSENVRPVQGGKFVQTRSGRVHCVDVGEGKPVLLFHGSGRSTADWQEGVVDLLSRHHRVIAFDYYGSGRSERNPEFTYGYGLW